MKGQLKVSKVSPRSARSVQGLQGQFKVSKVSELDICRCLSKVFKFCKSCLYGDFFTISPDWTMSLKADFLRVKTFPRLG